MTSHRTEDAEAIGQCLRYIQRDAERAGFKLATLHIKLAILELEAERKEGPDFTAPSRAPQRSRA